MFSAAGGLIWGVRPLCLGFLDLSTTKLAETMPLNLNQAWAAGMTFFRWIGYIPGRPRGVINRVPPAAFVIGFRRHRSGLSIPVGNGVV